jgi:hypothetical protein
VSGFAHRCCAKRFLCEVRRRANSRHARGIDGIEKYTRRGRTVFLHEELIQAWVVHHIEILGEAAGRVSKTVRLRHEGVLISLD